MPTFKVLLFDADGLEGPKDNLNRFGIKRENIKFLGNSPELQKYEGKYRPRYKKFDYSLNNLQEHSVRVVSEIKKQLPENVKIEFVVASTLNALKRSFFNNNKEKQKANIEYYSSTMKRVKPDIVLSTTSHIDKGDLKNDKLLLSISEAISKAAINNKLMYVSAIGNNSTIKNQYENSDNRISILSTRNFTNFPEKNKKGFVTIKEDGSRTVEQEEFLVKLKDLGENEATIKNVKNIASQFGTSYAAPQFVGMVLNALVSSPVNIGTLKQRRIALHTVLSIVREQYISADARKEKVLDFTRNFREDQTEKLVGDLDKIIKNNATLIDLEQNKPEPKKTNKLLFDNNNINLNGLLGGK